MNSLGTDNDFKEFAISPVPIQLTTGY